jgi:hypothetical protein
MLLNTNMLTTIDAYDGCELPEEKDELPNVVCNQVRILLSILVVQQWHCQKAKPIYFEHGKVCVK